MELADLWRETNNTSEPKLQIEWTTILRVFPSRTRFSRLAPFEGPLSNIYVGERVSRVQKLVANKFSTPCPLAVATIKSMNSTKIYW